MESEKSLFLKLKEEMDSFKEIKTYFSNQYCYIDQLDGVDLKDQEELEILFEDGFVRTYKIRIIESESVKEAYITVSIKGTRTLIHITGYKARRVNK